MPEMNAAGMKTQLSTSVMAMPAPVISDMAWWAAARGDRPSSMLRSTFSTTTMASSTTMPMASTSPNSDRLLNEKPNTAMTAKVPMTDTGSDTRGMSEVRQLCRKMKMTRATRKDDSNRVQTTSAAASDELGGVVGGGVGDALGEAPLQLLHLGADGLGGVEGVGAGQLEDGSHDGRLAV